jgi:hypothetical protein
MRLRQFSRVVGLGMLAAGLACPSASATLITSSSDFPPIGGQYVSPQGFEAKYLAGVFQLTDFHFLGFTPTPTYPLPAAGSPMIATFASTVHFMLSIDGGTTFTPGSATASFAVEVARVGSGLSGEPGVFDTEMLTLNIIGGTLPPLMRIRESPTLVSPGHTTVQGIGPFQIDSFFDVFTELSLDGGQSFFPQENGSTRLDLTSVPDTGATFSLLLIPLALYGISQLRTKLGSKAVGS